MADYDCFSKPFNSQYCDSCEHHEGCKEMAAFDKAQGEVNRREYRKKGHMIKLAKNLEHDTKDTDVESLKSLDFLGQDHKHAYQLHLMGYTTSEISGITGHSTMTVFRYIRTAAVFFDN